MPRAADCQRGPEVGKEGDKAHSKLAGHDNQPAFITGTFARDVLCMTVGTDLRPRANFSPCVKLEMSGSKNEVTSKPYKMNE